MLQFNLVLEVAWLVCIKIDSRSEYLFRTCSVVTSLVMSQIHSYYAVLQCYGEYGVTPYWLLPWARLTENQLILLVATELFGIPLIATRRNGEYTGSATSFSSFLKSKSQNNQLMLKLSWRWWLNVFFSLKSRILYFIFIFVLIFPGYLFYFPN